MDASGPACVYAVVQVSRGRVRYRHGNSFVCAPRHFGLFLPPFEIVQATLEVASVAQLSRVMSRLEQLKDVYSVQRDHG